MTEAHVFVDQIEGEMAVLVEDNKEHPIPLSDLPEGTQEGDWLSVQIPALHTFSSLLAAVADSGEKMPVFVLDENTKKIVKQRVQSLMDELSE